MNSEKEKYNVYDVECFWPSLKYESEKIKELIKNLYNFNNKMYKWFEFYQKQDYKKEAKLHDFVIKFFSDYEKEIIKNINENKDEKYINYSDYCKDFFKKHNDVPVRRDIFLEKHEKEINSILIWIYNSISSKDNEILENNKKEKRKKEISNNISENINKIFSLL